MGSCPTCQAIWEEGERCPRCLSSLPETVEDIRSSLRDEVRKALEESEPDPVPFVEPEREPTAVEELRSTLREEVHKILEETVADEPLVESASDLEVPAPGSESEAEREPLLGTSHPDFQTFVDDLDIPGPGHRSAYGGKRRQPAGLHPLEVRYWSTIAVCVLLLILVGGGESGSASGGDTSPKEVTSVKTSPTPAWTPEDAPPAVTGGVTATTADAS